MAIKASLRALAAYLSLSAAAVNAQQQAPAADDFIDQARNKHAFQIASGKLALEKSENDQVRDFAQMMVEDHTLAVKQLEAAVEDADPSMSVEPALTAPADSEHASSLPQSDHNIMINALQDAEVEGSAFNHVYLDSQVRILDEALSLFRRYAEHGDDSALTTYAEKMLPALEEHHARARELFQSMK